MKVLARSVDGAAGKARVVIRGAAMVLLLAALSPLGWFAADAVPPGRRGAAGTDQPNVILVVIDTLRADRLSHYGYDRDTSKALDGFAAEATRFERCYAPAPWTGPSTASIVSGLLPARHRVGIATALQPEIETIAERLRANGWKTAGFSLNAIISKRTRFDQGFDLFLSHRGKVRAYPDIQPALSVIRQWIGRGARPFFVYFQPMNVHGPYSVPSEYQSVLLGQAPGREFRFQDPLMRAITKGMIEKRKEVTPAYLASLNDQYDTAVRYTTDRLGEFFAALKRTEVYDNSLIIVTADHGEELFDHGGFGHGYTLYDEVLRVPLYVKMPHQRVARVMHEPVSLTDLYPTIMEVAGVPVPSGLDGRSLLPYLRADGSPSPAVDPRELVFDVRWAGRCTARGVLSGRYKLIRVEKNYESNENRVELFDVVDDPRERQNLATSEREAVTRLGDEMQERFARLSSQKVPSEPKPVQLDTQKLKALGYL
jgi:arylsulfatase A-like enzyme